MMQWFVLNQKNTSFWLNHIKNYPQTLCTQGPAKGKQQGQVQNGTFTKQRIQ